MKKPYDFPPLIPELLITDIAVSLPFYTDVLGFAVAYQRPENNFAMLERQGAWIMLDQLVPGSDRSWIAGPLEKPFGRGMNLEIRTTNINELYATCQKAKAAIFLPIEEKWYRADDNYLGSRQFIVLDPDGYLLRFAESLGAAGELPFGNS